MQFADKAGLCCSLTESMDTTVYIDERIMLNSECKNAHVDLDLRCSLMVYETFSHVVHHIIA